MSQPSAHPLDSYGQPLPLGLDRLFGAMNALGSLWILVLMALMNLDVAGRNLFNTPVRGVTEMVSLSIVGIVFLQLADTLHSGRFTRAEVLLERLKRSRPVGAPQLSHLSR
jgi:TRAP-type mannitol/chloroaromatic compound transport system permease small subunit